MLKFLLILFVVGTSFSAMTNEKEYICGENVICDEGLVRLKTTEEPVTGSIRGYSSDGKLEVDEKVIDGKIDGLRKIYYNDMRIEVNYDKGVRQGTSTSFYPNGNMHKQFIYKDDVIDGVAKFYYEDGQLAEEVLYENDKKITTLSHYNKKGRKVFYNQKVLDKLNDAVQTNNKNQVKEILTQNPNLNLDPPYIHMYINKPLFLAARSADVEMLKILLDYGADIEGMCSYDDTPLITALEHQKYDNARFLIENGADVNKANSFAMSPLIGLANFGPSDLFILAMQHGGDIHKKNPITACSISEKVNGYCPEKYGSSVEEIMQKDIKIPDYLELSQEQLNNIVTEIKKNKQYLVENGYLK